MADLRNVSCEAGLDLFEIGKGKANRPTEILFVGRCLNLLKPGGRIGIVLPEGNLNIPRLRGCGAGVRG